MKLQNIRDLAVVALVGFGMIYWALSMSPIIVQRTVIKYLPKDDCPLTQNNQSETIYLIDKSTTTRLPFCALVSDWSKDVICYDWAYWDGNNGVSVFNIKSGTYPKP